MWKWMASRGQNSPWLLVSVVQNNYGSVNVKRFMYQILYLFTCRSTQMTQVWWLTQTPNLISRTQCNTMDSTAPFKSKLTVRCESRFSTPFAILDSCANQESRIENREQATKSQESSLAGQKQKIHPWLISR